MPATRTRRAKAKSINYAKEQEFSDGDVFEDSPNEDPTPKRSRARPRKNNNAETPMEYDEVGGGYKPSKPIYTEKGYDTNLPPIRERFPFLPEYEPDGSPRIDLIVGRRPIDEKEAKDEGGQDDSDGENEDPEDESDEEPPARGKRRGRGSKKEDKQAQGKKKATKQTTMVEYEYLVKYKGRSYLHLEWKTGADLESMNKSAKTLYRRYLKKLAAGQDEELEDPNFDPSFVLPQKIIAEAEQEFSMELSDKELLEWEKEREKQIAEEEDEEDSDDDDDDDDDDKDDEEEEKKDENDASDMKSDDKNKSSESNNDEKTTSEPQTSEGKEDEVPDDWEAKDIDFSTLTIERLRKILDKDGPYYPKFEGSDNPYRDGYITEPPKKPRASYLFFQCTMRSYFAKRNRTATQGELMTILGDQWKAMSESEQAPFIELAKEEAKHYEHERFLMEKAQKPNEVWQPIRRCLMVLDRISNDGFANIFLEPVDTEEFNDYEEVIDQPMDLGTVRKKLKSKKYQAPEQFARDVRKVWNNCKIYNRHGSAIWHVADYMSKQFERLYHAWVLEFRERYLRWANPKARPWEHSCRQCDGKCGTPDDDLVLCDHCDAMYGIKCLDPPLKKLPTGIWHCPDCKKKLHSVRGVRMMSAISEQAARKRAELGDTPKRKVKQTMYLVKWSGLGYENCTWETKDDIGNPGLLAEYRKLNNSFPDEPDMPEEDVTKVLEATKHLHPKIAGGSSCVPSLRSQLYVQSRAFQFTKFGLDLPEELYYDCGPTTKACQSTSNSNKHPKEVVECLSELTFRVAWKDTVPQLVPSKNSLPPPMTGEYDTIVPITSQGLMMNVGEIHGSVAFLGYRSFPDGSKGPAAQKNLIRNVGDKIIAVDGKSTVNLSFKEVIMLLRESGKNKFAFMRFLENKYSICDSDLASVGNLGKYATVELRRKFSTDRKRTIVDRNHKVVEEEPVKEEKAEESDASAAAQESDDESSEGEFQPDSDDEEMAAKNRESNNDGHGDGDEDEDDQQPVPPKQENGVVVKAEKSEASPGADAATTTTTTAAPPTSTDGVVAAAPEGEVKSTTDEEKKTVEAPPNPNSSIKQEEKMKIDKKVLAPQVQNAPLACPETTQSLAYRLLSVDVGYSSDEGGDEDCAYYIDGVDDTFTSKAEISADVHDEEDDMATSKSKAAGLVSDTTQDNLPVKKNDFVALGDRSKLVASVSLTGQPPDFEDFVNFPFESAKEIELKKAKERQAMAVDVSGENVLNKPIKLSTVKVEQVSTTTNDTIHVWASAEAAAATLQIPLGEIKSVLRGEYDEDVGDEVGGFRWRYAASDAIVTAGSGSKSKGSKKGKEAWLEFRDRLYDPAEPHIYKNGNRLRDYQVEGVNWLASTYYRKHGCILADEMGLGKTVQIVSYLEHLYRVEKIHRPFLVVVPLSTVEHWRREFEGWTEMVCCVYHDRQRVWRDVLREYEWYFEDRPHTGEYLKFDVLVTTYDTLIGDFDVISQIPFRAAVVDEAHRLRNQKGKLLECMREISAKGTMQYGFQSRVLMSGTPLQNDLMELWTLLNFIEPFKFPDLDEFMFHFGNMANKEQVEALQRKISPFMLRRVKEDVAKDIPAKEETVIDVELTSIQKQYYRAIFEHNHAFLNMGSGRSNAPKLMNIQMELRKVCNHPCLLEGVEHREQERQFKDFLEKGAFEGKTPEEQQHMLNEHLYIMTSGKMVLMDKLLPKLRQEGHKVLVFSQMVKMLDLISEYCEFKNFPYERLDGRVRGTDRQKSIDRFEREENSFLFLLSTRAGGVGINLTAADICIIFDSDWNPQNDVQAQARCHRIGQTKDVRIYRLITSRSFEQEMFDRASKKLGLEQAVLGSFGQDDDDDKPTSKEMEQLLKKGAYALLEDDNDEVTNAFCADDIESILAKRTRTRVVEGAKTASWLNKQGMVVSKSKFTSDSKSADLDMDDPLFWQKVMPDFVTPSIMLQKLQDLSDEILGTSGKGKGRGRGRGRGRWKRQKEKEEEKTIPEEESTAKEEEEKAEEETKETADDAPAKEESTEPTESNDAEETAENDDENPSDEDDDKKYQLTRTNQRKVAKYMSDLKSMMESVFDEAEDNTLPSDEKATAQKLLLTITVKEKLFNEEQRHLARTMLKRLEGNRRRRCRTSDQNARFSPGRRPRNEEGTQIREELRIVGKKGRKRRKRRGEDGEPIPKRRRKAAADDDSGAELGEDGYLVHSDDEADWSDVAEDLYQGGKKRPTISRKEARRRRQWAADDDAATAAGRAWPALPRNIVGKVLGSLLDEVMKHDDAKGGVFSVPVPRDEFPEYYDQIDQPMDYGTMKAKLDKGDYRSAQAMQKDFILVMQNCLKFNAPDSEIVQEARQQALMRPNLLRNAALKHDLFLAEDGSVLDILDDDAKKKDKGDGTPKKRGRKKKTDVQENTGDTPAPKKRRGRKPAAATPDRDEKAQDDEEDDAPLASLRKRKPRIKISLTDGKEPDKERKVRKKMRKRGSPAPKGDYDTDDENRLESTPIPKKRRRRTQAELNGGDDGGVGEDEQPKRKARKKGSKVTDVETAEDVDIRAAEPEEEQRPDPTNGEEAEDGEVDADVEGKDKSHRPSRREEKEKRSRRSDPSSLLSAPSTREHGDDSVFLNPGKWKRERELLDSSFQSARSHFEKEGRWKLPAPLEPVKFRDVALATLIKLGRLDRYSVFAEEVSESEAPGYYDVVKNPTDLSKIRTKVEDGTYGEGSEAASKLYEDFLLMFDNCNAYNDDDGEVIEEAARLFSLLPEVYAHACASAAKKQRKGL